MGTPFDDELARRIATAAVEKKGKAGKVGLFAAYKDLNNDDLVQDCITAIFEDWPSYNPQYAPSTYMTMIAERHLLDVSRRRSSERRRQRAAAVADVSFDDLVAGKADYADGTIAEWVAHVYAAARKKYTAKRWRNGRKFYNVAQYVAIAALCHRLKLTIRACETYLTEKQDVRDALKLHRVPTYRSIARAIRFVRQELVTTSAQVVTESRDFFVDEKNSLRGCSAPALALC